ncbi:MAG TPA: hypothetical protein VG755_41785, partial [Nannocystaceae bacterium]|nr:hypothetical protein [Nannocystaceae bacterium]
GLWVIASDGTSAWSIPFDADPRADTGHDLFHQDAGNGLACASCHPEGSDDGFVWTLDAKRRRTLSLRVGLDDTEPFHWTGDFPGFPRIVDDIYTARMGGLELSDARYDAFRGWVYGLEPLRSEPGDAVQVGRGAVLFASLGCGGCHDAAALVDGRQADLGVSLQVPSLVGIAQRPPYMHDGRLTDLASAVGQMVLDVAPNAELSFDDSLALTAYVASL